MKKPIVIIGIGELGSVFSRGFLRLGHPVYPITRQMNIQQESQTIPEPEFVLIAVQEDELHPVLEQLPSGWQDKIGLIQNELLPKDWRQHQITDPTVTVVWFEKKKHMEVANILYSPSYGPHAHLMSEALKIQGIPAPVLNDFDTLLYELLRKSLYIQTVNIAGIVNNCSVNTLWEQHQNLARQLAEDILQILEQLTQTPLDHERLIAGMVEGIKDCPERKCQGRRATERLKRALNYADQFQLTVPSLRKIQLS
jgi:ketopantoate reductase